MEAARNYDDRIRCVLLAVLAFVPLQYWSSYIAYYNADSGGVKVMMCPGERISFALRAIILLFIVFGLKNSFVISIIVWDDDMFFYIQQWVLCRNVFLERIFLKGETGDKKKEKNIV